jgi:hypothetical protein
VLGRRRERKADRSENRFEIEMGGAGGGVEGAGRPGSKVRKEGRRREE